MTVSDGDTVQLSLTSYQLNVFKIVESKVKEKRSCALVGVLALKKNVFQYFNAQFLIPETII